MKDRLKAVVHVIPQKSLDWKGLEIQLQELKLHFDHVLGVKPTGWTHSTGTGTGTGKASKIQVQRYRFKDTGLKIQVQRYRFKDTGSKIQV